MIVSRREFVKGSLASLGFLALPGGQWAAPAGWKPKKKPNLVFGILSDTHLQSGWDGVTFGKGWTKRHNNNGEQVGDWTHFAKEGAWRATYPLPVEKAGRYALMGKTPYAHSAKPGSQTAFELTSGGKTESFFFDQAQGTGFWQKIGEFDLEPGATLAIVPAKSKGFIVADGFALVPLP